MLFRYSSFSTYLLFRALKCFSIHVFATNQY